MVQQNISKGTIVYFGGFELPDKNAAAHRVLGIGKILNKLNYEVVYVGTSQEMQSRDAKFQENNSFNFESWTVGYPKGLSGWFSHLFSVSNFKKVLKNYKNVRAVILYNYPGPAMFEIMRICRKKNIKVISDCTEWYGAQGENLGKRLIKGLDSFIRMRILNKKVDGVISISTFLSNYYKNNENIITIPPLVDKEEKKWDKVTSNDIDKIRLVFSGTVGRNKEKIDSVIDIIFNSKVSSKIEMNILGVSKEDYLSAYPTDKEKLSALDSYVHFLGRVSHTESLNAIKKSDFSMFIRENNQITNAGFPTKLVESLSCGVPVITNDTSDIKRYIITKQNGFIIEETNLKVDFDNILKLPINELKNMKYNVNDSEFDYQNWIKPFEIFMKKCLGKETNGGSNV